MTPSNTGARFRALSVAATVASTLVLSGAATAAPKAPQQELTCTSSIRTLGVDPNGGLWLNNHLDPANGEPKWGENKLVGTGWTGRTIAGPNGSVYAFIKEGEIHRWRWNGTGWDAPPPGQAFDVIARGEWIKKFLTPEFRNRVAFDGFNHMYTVEANGELWVNPYNAQARVWGPARMLAKGWDRYNAIFTTFDGVIYGRDNAGKLFRHHYNATSQRWIDETGVEIGNGGWQQFTRLFSPGGEVVYGMTKDGQLKWHRVTDRKLDPRSGKVLVSNWTAEADITAFTDQCGPAQPLVPERPQVWRKNNARTNLSVSADGRIHHSFVGTDRRVVDAIQQAPGNLELEVHAAGGHDGANGVPAVGMALDGTQHLVTQNVDSDMQRSTFGRTWQLGDALNGRMGSEPAIIRNEFNELSVYAFDGGGWLWQRTQVGQNGAFGPWRKVSVHPETTAFTPDAPAVLRAGRDNRIFALDKWGAIQYVDVAPDHVPSTGTYWQKLTADVTFVSRPTVIEQPGGGQSVVARGSDGKIRVITGSNKWGGFKDATWKVVGDRAFAGEPQATTSPNGLPAISARDANGALYFTEQGNDGTFLAWELVSDPGVSATELSMIRYGANTVLLSFRDTEDQLYIGTYEWGQKQAPGAGAKRVAKVKFTKAKKVGTK
ncbi:tachylectin-related carbohydrate-binding protein [Allokutzneria sp. A3M-2-11 16]|uniref:tachylectin-related carbohydrate-binding protein n=1 Tax=Allokutzneria sp. A3M-2-11 16 TaxID=2962043 RepID=UPI0020B7594A|nr:tachylectin-related carbohydrate-binding protein [Allokutzneria sp. A3M-2-11 16]MCP3799988.1 tachylectin-related carbohydrate-binding protein [Allokutzneria sp. A3M-2-11 16]